MDSPFRLLYKPLVMSTEKEKTKQKIIFRFFRIHKGGFLKFTKLLVSSLRQKQKRKKKKLNLFLQNLDSTALA